MESSPAYENSLHFSPCFQSYAESLAARLIDRHDLHGQDIIEIGCGRGDFLRLLCKLGGNRGVGFDPSYEPEQSGGGSSTDRITFIRDFYSERYAGYEASLICCRHVLEHIQIPRDFLNQVRHSIRNRLKTIVFFEVPNVLFTLRDLGIWDLIYEHCSYFSGSSLSRLFTSCGFDVCDLNETYGGQFLSIEARPGEGLVKSGPDPREDFEELVSDIPPFSEKYWRKVEAWRQKLERRIQAGQRIVVWGGGSKGVTFLNALETQGQIEYVVDINPRKQGGYVAGTGQRIVAPDFLRDYHPDLIIVMNPIYQTEIKKTLEGLGIASDIECES
jgi:SAM-dependent methyltransferase